MSDHTTVEGNDSNSSSSGLLLPTGGGSMFLGGPTSSGSALRGAFGSAAAEAASQGHAPSPATSAPPGSMGPPPAPSNRNASLSQGGGMYSNGSTSGSSNTNPMLDSDGDTSLTSATRGPAPSSRAPSDRWSLQEETSLADLLYANVDAQNLLLPCRSRHLCTNSSLTSRSISGDLAKLLWGEHMVGRWERVQKKVGHLHKQYLRKREKLAEAGREKLLGQLEENEDVWRERKAILVEVPWFEKWHEMALSPASDPALATAPAPSTTRRKTEGSAKPQTQSQQLQYNNTLVETLRRAAMGIEDNYIASITGTASSSRDILGGTGRGISSSNDSIEMESDSDSEDDDTRRMLRAAGVRGVKAPRNELGSTSTSHKRKRSDSNVELASTLVEALEASKRKRAEARLQFEQLRLTRERETRAWEKEKLDLMHAREREREAAHHAEMQRLVDVVEKALAKGSAMGQHEQEEEEEETPY